MNSHDTKTKDKLVGAYRQMMTRVKEALQHTKTKTLRQHIDIAQDKAVELQELTREEAERVGDYLHRDLEDAAHYVVTTKQALADWMRFDLELIEERVLEMFSVMVDHTQVELENLAERARYATEWYSGEITGPGTLQCDNCGKTLHFHQPDYIHPCPNCNATLFKRVVDEENDE
jgi:rubrerythrin